ncbi:MAG: hypothetical protein AB7N80_15140 [Bdellovibrionales bacterium]
MAQAQTSTMPTPAEAGSLEAMKPHFGVRAGLSDTNENYNTAGEFGAEIGFQPYVPIGVALEFSTFSSNGQGKADLDRSHLLARGTYNFSGNTFVRHTFLGAGAGVVRDTSGDDTDTRMGLAVLGGFDVPIAGSTVERREFTVGANANYLFVSNSGADTFSLNGALKYWF